MSETLYRKAGPRRYEAVQVDPCLRHFDTHMLLIAATRYFTGRKTIATCAFAEELARAWPEIPASTRNIIRQGLEEAFKEDDEARARGDQYKPLGHDCDRKAWGKVREAWQKIDIGEKTKNG